MAVPLVNGRRTISETRSQVQRAFPLETAGHGEILGRVKEPIADVDEVLRNGVPGTL
jgi:hypothetical protein